MMVGMKSQPEYRRIEEVIELAAPVEAVWKALTDAEELSRWYPISARVVPGKGGSMFLSWGPDCEGEAPITAWEENRHLQIVEQAPQPGAGPYVQDFYLEARGGRTILRFVHSGFGSADWENDYFDSLDNGWGFMFANLRHYFARHYGRPRRIAWPRRRTGIPRAEAWKRLAAASGPFGADLEMLRPGSRYSLRAATGDVFAGEVIAVDPPRKIIVTAEGLGDALLFVNVEGAPRGNRCEVYLWVSAYTVPQAELDAFTARWQPTLDAQFPEPWEEK
jgi:uncharacterized protein YndB with AHSA1/START domain